MDLPSSILNNAVEQFASLPGIGRKTALRLTLHLLGQPEEDVKRFSDAFTLMKANIKYCKKCHNISDAELCGVCSNTKRNENLLCVVEDMRDVIAIENTQQYNGLFHVLGGNISPMEGIGPNDLNIDSLIHRIESEEITEIVFALSTTMEGDTTNFYLYKKLAGFDVKITTIARGVAIGDELEYTDEVTLGRSILNRTPYESTFKR